MAVTEVTKTVFRDSAGAEFGSLREALAADALADLQRLGFRPEVAGNILRKAEAVCGVLGTYIEACTAAEGNAAQARQMGDGRT